MPHALCANQVSNASHSSSSPMFNHRSPSGPSPCHRTRYRMPCLRLLSPMIFLMKNSCAPSTLTRFGGRKAWVGNRVLSFASKGFTLEVCKMGNSLDWFGRVRVTVKHLSSVETIRYGPSNWGINLATQWSSPVLYIWHLCDVNRTTLSLTLNGKISCWWAFSWWACLIFTVSRLSCAFSYMGCICVISSRAEGSVCLVSSRDMMGGKMCTAFLKQSWNGKKPVDAFMVFIISNQTLGSVWTQPCWLHSTAKWIHWMIVLFVSLLTLSNSG